MKWLKSNSVFDVIVKFDTTILSEFTKAAHNFQRLTGRTNYFLARIGVFISAIYPFLLIANRFHRFLREDTSGFGKLIDAALWLALLFYDSLKCEQAEKGFNSSPTALTMHPIHIVARISWWILFTFCLLSNVLGSIWGKPVPFIDVVFYSSCPLGQIIYAYFVSVTPQPPSESKVSKWVRSLHTRLVPAKVGTN